MCNALASRLIVFDLETTGLEPTRDRVLQIGAVALDERLSEVGTFEVKVRLEGAVGPTTSDGEQWDKASVDERDAARRFQSFLKEHATVRRETARGKPFLVSEVSGYNAAFDVPFLHAWFARLGEFLPAAYHGRCVMQRAFWFYFEHGLPAPVDWKLGTLCEAFGVELGENAHDALFDAQATAELYRAMVAGRLPVRVGARTRTKRPHSRVATMYPRRRSRSRRHARRRLAV